MDQQKNLSSLFEEGDNVSVDATQLKAIESRHHKSRQAASATGEPYVSEDPLLKDSDPVVMASFRDALLPNSNSGDPDSIDDIFELVQDGRRSDAAAALRPGPGDKKNSLIKQVNTTSLLGDDPAADNQILNGNLWLLKGGGDLQRFEHDFSEAQAQAQSHQSTRAKNPKSFMLGLPIYTIRQLQAREDFDLIIVDFSPSPSAINRITAMSLDFILPPCFADTYSASSVSGLLETVLPDWYHWQENAVKIQKEELAKGHWGDADKMWMLPEKPPQICAFLASNYATSQDHVVYHASNFIGTLKDYVERDFLERDRNGLSKHFLPINGRMVLSFVPRLVDAHQISQEMGRTIHELYGGSDENCARGYLDYYDWEAVPDDEFDSTDRTMKQSELDQYVKEVRTCQKRLDELAKWLQWVQPGQALAMPPATQAGQGEQAAAAAGAADLAGLAVGSNSIVRNLVEFPSAEVKENRRAAAEATAEATAAAAAAPAPALRPRRRVPRDPTGQLAGSRRKRKRAAAGLFEAFERKFRPRTSDTAHYIPDVLNHGDGGAGPTLKVTIPEGTAGQQFVVFGQLRYGKTSSGRAAAWAFNKAAPYGIFRLQ